MSIENATKERKGQLADLEKKLEGFVESGDAHSESGARKSIAILKGEIAELESRMEPSERPKPKASSAWEARKSRLRK